MKVSAHAAKTQLSKLLDLVEDGEEVVISATSNQWRA